jgi:hypothetical protein
MGILYPQGEEETIPSNELVIQIQNAPNRTITFELIPIGTHWAWDGVSSGCNYLILSYNPTFINSLTANSSGYVDCLYNGFNYRHYSDNDYTQYYGCSTAGMKPLRTGFYRVNILENSQLKTYAFFDWRDVGFTADQICHDCNRRDMTIRYNASTEELWFWAEGGYDINISNQNPDKELSDGDLITWADWQCDERDFSIFWSNGLVAIPKYNSSTGQYNPRLVWGPYPDTPIGSILGYRIYKASNHFPGNPGTFTEFTVVDDDVFEYVDVSETMGQYYTANSYYIVLAYEDPWDTPQETSPTNTVEVREAYPQKEKAQDDQTNEILDFNLFQNYPNPFNPTTSISFSIQTKGKVHLKVFDVLGNEIETLADGEFESGTYSTEFNAEDLSSGIYFYTIVTNEFRKTNKMILAK